MATSNVSTSDVGNDMLPPSLLVPATRTLSAEGTGDLSPSLGTPTQAFTHKSSLKVRRASSQSVTFDEQAPVSYAVRGTESESPAQVHLSNSEATSQPPSIPTLVLSDDSQPEVITDFELEDSKLKDKGLKAVRTQRMGDLKKLKDKYPGVLSCGTESTPASGDDNLDSRSTSSYNEVTDTVFKCFTVYPFSTYCVLRFSDEREAAPDSEHTNPKVNASCTNELFRELKKRWNEWGLLRAITSSDFMKKKLDTYLEDMLADERWADLARTAISYDMKDMSSMLESVSKRHTVDVAMIANSVLEKQPSLSGASGGVLDGTTLALSNILQLFIDEKDSQSPILLRLLRHMMDIIGLHAIPTSMYISDKGSPTKLMPMSGSYGVVKQMKMGHAGLVATKKLMGGTQVKSLVRESYVWKQLDHINVLPFYGLYIIPEDQLGTRSEWDPPKEDTLPAMVSPWMNNGDLTSFLKNHADLSCEDRRKICIGIAKGLLYLHTRDPKIIHGDLKGLNILFDENGLPKLADFGLFRIIDDNATRQMSRRFESETMTTKTDVLHFGFVMFEVYTGRQHMRNDNRKGCVIHRTGKLSDEIWSIIEKCCDYEAEERPDIAAVLHYLYPWKPLPFLSHVHKSGQVKEDAEGKSSETLMIPNHDYVH